MIISRSVLLRMKNVSDKFCRGNGNTFLFNTFFSDNRAVYEIMWKNMVPPDRLQITSRMCFTCWITKAINTHSEYRGCPRRNVRDFERVFLMLNYTDITQNTYIQSWTVTEIMAREKCGHLAFPRTVRLQLCSALTLREQCGTHFYDCTSSAQRNKIAFHYCR